MQPGTKVAIGIIASCVVLSLGLGIAIAMRRATANNPAKAEGEAPGTKRQISEQSQADKRPRPSSEEGRSSEEPPIRIDVGQLWGAYRTNAIAADERYKGKTLEVTGSIGRITSDAVGFVMISFPGLDNAQYNRLTPREKRWFNEGFPPNVV